jgi:TonB family protein
MQKCLRVLVLLMALCLMACATAEEEKQPDLSKYTPEQKVYYDYYSQVKKHIRLRWERDMKELVRANPDKFREKKLTSKVYFEVDPEGGISKIEVFAPSGFRPFDDTALKALNNSQPMPIPPASIIKNGVVHARWDFIIDAD